MILKRRSIDQKVALIRLDFYKVNNLWHSTMEKGAAMSGYFLT